MSDNSRLSRKAKKEMKKNPEEWNNYLEEKRREKEKQENLDLIFTRSYDESLQIVRRMIRTGK